MTPERASEDDSDDNCKETLAQHSVVDVQLTWHVHVSAFILPRQIITDVTVHVSRGVAS